MRIPFSPLFLPCFKAFSNDQNKDLALGFINGMRLWPKEFNDKKAHMKGRKNREEIRVLGIFIDLQKAFDTVNHKILTKKLSYYGFR